MNVRIVPFCHAFLLAASTLAAAQNAVAPPSAPAFTEADSAFAKYLAAMTPTQANAAIANATPAQITPGAATALRILGNAVIAKQPQTALTLYQESVQIAQRLNAPSTAAKALVNEGNAYRSMNNPEAALDAYDKAVAAYESSNGIPTDLGLAFSARALQRKDLGDLDGAIEDGHRALDDYQQTTDEVSLARTLNNLGTAEATLGRFSDAREHFEWGLRLARTQKQRLGEAFLLNNIADTYLQQSNPALAVDYCLQSVKIKEQLGNNNELVTSLVNLARIYHSSGQTSEALRTIGRASALARESGRVTLIVTTLLESGILEAAQKHNVTALAMLNEGLTLARKPGLHLLEHQLLAQIAEVELSMHRYADAARDAEGAITFATQAGFQENLADSAYTAGRAHRELGNVAQSRAALQASITAIEFMRDNVAGGDQARSQFFAHRGDPYQELVSLDASQGESEDALLTSEREKGRALLDLLTHGPVNLASQLTPAEATEEKRLRAHLATLENKRSATSDPPSLYQQWNVAHAALSSFNERMYAAHPELSRHRGNAPLITLQQTALLLARTSSAILEYEVTPSATYLFAITPGKSRPTLQVYTIPITASALKTRVSRFRTAIANRDPDFTASATGLYRLLLAPAKADLANSRSLIIVPSGELWHLPFQALQPSTGKYLVETTSVSYAPSLSVLRAYSLQPHQASRTHTLLAFGNPIGDMPEAAQEVQTLSTLYGTTHARSFTGPAATKTNFRTYAAQYDIVHLATHGIVDDRNPMYSHLIFAAASTPSTQSKLSQLDASEIAETSLSASLVVLSACETAGGKFQDGDGLIGLASSFLAAGSQSAIASQWRVESSSTTELMIALHRSLQHHLSKAEALRQAELSVAKQPRYRHPFYWAGFVLIGEN